MRSNPNAVIHSDARWYLIGHCIHRRAIRTFRLDRVTKITTRPNTFERPAAFDPRAYLAAQMPFISSNFQIDVWIDMPIAEAQKSFAIWRVAMQPEAGGTRLRCGRDTLELFAAMLLATNRRIVVHQPAALRKTFRTLARRAHQAAEKPKPPVLGNKPSRKPKGPHTLLSGAAQAIASTAASHRSFSL